VEEPAGPAVVERQEAAPVPAARPGRFQAAAADVSRRLPFGLGRIVTPSMLGFAVINGFTFAVDLSLLTVFHAVLGWPLPAAITLSYLMAFGLSFLLNRRFNFRSHGAIGGQATIYLVAIGLNYAVFILGVTDGLAHLGAEYHLARLAGGSCEAIYMYSVMRWVVFADRGRPRRGRTSRRRPAGRRGGWDRSRSRGRAADLDH
jgi:putative flippase GtrA